GASEATQQRRTPKPGRDAQLISRPPPDGLAVARLRLVRHRTNWPWPEVRRCSAALGLPEKNHLSRSFFDRAMSSLTTHVLDTSRGIPARGLTVELWSVEPSK